MLYITWRSTRLRDAVAENIRHYLRIISIGNVFGFLYCGLRVTNERFMC